MNAWEAEFIAAFGSKRGFNVRAAMSAKQLAFDADEHRYRIWLGGRRSGKTYGQAAHMLLCSMPGETTPYVAPTIGIGMGILWPQLELLDHQFKIGLQFNRQSHEVQIPNNGGTIKTFGLSSIAEAEKFRGKRYPLAFVDETGAIPERVLSYAVRECLSPATKDFLGLGGRGLVLAGTPSRTIETWWHKECKRARDEGFFHFTTIYDNPFFAGREELVIAEYCKEFGLARTAPAVRREWDGEFVVDTDALCYTWNQEIYARPDLGMTILGLDLGLRHPCAFVVLRIVNGTVYCIHVEKQVDMITPEIAQKITELRQRFSIGHMVGDSEAAGTIADLNRNYGIPIESAKKLGDKLGRIWMLASRLRADTFRVCDGCDDLTDELNSVGWNEDRDDHHEKQRDDACDATHYALELASAISRVGAPEPPKRGTPAWYVAEQQRMRNQAEKQARATARRGLA